MLLKSKCIVGAAICLLASSGTAAAQNVVVKSCAAGSGENNAGIVDASEDTEIDGPQALTSDEDGALYLLDQVNSRIVRFDPKRPADESTILRLPGDLRPSDLIVRNSDILVWDGSVRSLRAAPRQDNTSTRGLEEVSTRAADDQTVLSAFAQMGSQQPASATELLDANTRAAAAKQPRRRARQHVASRGAGSVFVDVIPEDRGSGARIEVRRESGDSPPMSQLRLKVRDQLGAVEFLEIEHGGHMYVFAENLPSASGNAAAFVARFSSSGTLEGVYELPLSNVPLSRRFVTVSGDGEVYFLRTENKAVEVLGVGFRAMPNAKVIDVRGQPAVPAASKWSQPGPVTAVRPLTRQRGIETAFAFEGVQWTVNAAAYGRDPDTACSGFAGRVRRPGYLHGKLQQEVRGMPYCWGCHGSLDQIRSKIERGVLAGNICTHNAP